MVLLTVRSIYDFPTPPTTGSSMAVSSLGTKGAKDVSIVRWPSAYAVSRIVRTVE